MHTSRFVQPSGVLYRFFGIFTLMISSLISFSQLPAKLPQNEIIQSKDQTKNNTASTKLRDFSDFFNYYDQEFDTCNEFLDAMDKWIFIYMETADRALAGNTRAQQSIRIYATENSPFQYMIVKETQRFSETCTVEVNSFFEKYSFDIQSRQNLLKTRFGF
ncbi:MAG: hypothetical protein ACOC2E_00745 [Bacteroidota bacterium]